MNTDKTLREKFASNFRDYPIWYYKKIEKIEVDDVIFNLLKETFVVELNNKKITMTFGKNRKHEIGCTQSSNEGLDYTSYKCIRKAFTEGKWFRITEVDTSDEFKENYKIQEKERERVSIREGRIHLITNALEILKERGEAPSEQIDNHIKELQNASDEELESLTNSLFKGIKTE